MTRKFSPRVLRSRRAVPKPEWLAALACKPAGYKPIVELLEDRLAPNDVVGTALTVAGPPAAAHLTAEIMIAGAAPVDVVIADAAATPAAESFLEQFEPVSTEPEAAPAAEPITVPPTECVIEDEVTPLGLDPFAAAEALLKETTLEALFTPDEEPEVTDYLADSAPLEKLPTGEAAIAASSGGSGAAPARSPAASTANGLDTQDTSDTLRHAVNQRLALAASAAQRLAQAASSLFQSPGFPGSAALLTQGFVQMAWRGQQTFARPNEWLVSFRGVTGSVSEQVSQINSILAQATPGAAVKDHLGSAGQVLVQTPGGISHTAFVTALSGVADVDAVDPNFAIWSTATPNDAGFGNLWGLHNTGQSGGTADADIDAPEAWNLTTGSTANPVVVGIIDTGIDYTHPDLAANIWVNAGEIAGNGIDDDGNGYIDDIHGWDFVNNDSNPMDDNGHGTHVAGTIAGVGNNGTGVVGVNWSAQVMALKFLDANGSGTTANAVKAVNYATANGARLTNNSWGGGGYSSTLYNAINAARSAGVLFIAAAGNSGSSTASYPAAYNLDNVISVAATDRNDALASFSNYGSSWVDLAAPGVSILSTVPGGYSYYSGTSMATPHVAGVAALAWAYSPDATYAQVRDAILQGADAKASLAGKTATGARLNAFSTLQRLGAPTVTVPAAPTNLAATAASSSQVNLSWSDNSSNETGFAIDYATSSTFSSGVTTLAVGANLTSRSITGLAAGTTYYFRIRATNSAGASANSSTVSATTQQNLPAAPSNLTATAVSSSQINLTWADNSSNETGFAIDVATSSSFTGATTLTVGANVTGAGISGLAAGTTYYFRVRATNGAGASANSGTASATTTAPAPSGDGLRAQYYNNSNFTSLRLTRVDPTINFNWGSGSPASNIASNTFSVRWTGKIVPRYTETYTFFTTSDDGVRVWVNGQLIINNWTNHAPTVNTGTITLTAGQKYDIRVEYYENTGGAVMKLEWQSASQVREVIPKSQLFSA